MQIVSVNKPYGWPTHQVDEGKIGFVEHLEKQLAQKLFVVHRLDKTTTGTMVFAKDAETAKDLQVAFAERQVHKQYYFITDRESPQKKIQITSHIEATKEKTYISHSQKPSNSHTDFEHVKTYNKFSLWIARPMTGKTHQIRLHAQQAGIPLLGDTLYGGSDYSFLLLHSQSLQIKDTLYTAPLPAYLEDLSLLENPLLVRAIRAIEDRKLCFSPLPSILRWLHKEIEWLCVDQLGEHLWFQCFETHSQAPELIKNIHHYLESTLQRKFSYHIQTMPNRGISPQQKLVEDFADSRWQAEEHGIQYEFRSDSGSSYGLFLDQRLNRKWLLEQAKDQRVLNLFCYTGGFSLCALKAGAKQVCSVDTSKATLEWLDRNITINNFSAESHESWSVDARVFLKGAKSRHRKFDIVVCDPPSFSRGKEGVFRIEKDLPELLQQCVSVLDKAGILLLSTNFEGWTQKDFRQAIETHLPKSCRVLGYTSSDVDYEAPTESRILKAVFISMI